MKNIKILVYIYDIMVYNKSVQGGLYNYMNYLKTKLNDIRLANEKLGDSIRKGGFHLYYDFIQDSRLDGVDIWVLNYLIDVEPIVEHLATDRRYFMICERFALEGLRLKKPTLYYNALNNLLEYGYIAKLSNGHGRCFYALNYNLIIHQYDFWCHKLVEECLVNDDEIKFNDEGFREKYQKYVTDNNEEEFETIKQEIEKKVLKKVPETKEKDQKDDTEVSEILEHLNNRTNKNYRKGSAFVKLIKARLKDGYTVDDFKKVIDNKCNEWLGTDWETYLRPNTLFAPSHFDDYLNQPAINPVTKKPEINKTKEQLDYERMKNAYDKAGSNGSIMNPDTVMEVNKIRENTYKQNDDYAIIRQSKANTTLWAKINNLIEQAVDSGALDRKYRVNEGDYDPRLDLPEAAKLFSCRDYQWIENKFNSGCVKKEEYLNGIE